MNESVQLPDDAMLSVRGITKAFGSNSVLKGIDMDIAKGSVVALIGGNGAGKSTLVKIIMAASIVGWRRTSSSFENGTLIAYNDAASIAYRIAFFFLSFIRTLPHPYTK